MGAILNMFQMKMGIFIARIFLLLLAVYSSYGDDCNFPEHWTGVWFQSGITGLISINSSTIQGKGECVEADVNNFVVYNRDEDCYSCLVIHERHKYVLQYKETNCMERDSLSMMCEMIAGDSPLYSMFRKEPKPVPEPCPIYPTPFTFTYNKGSGDCVYPTSRVESCTDDTQLTFHFSACADVLGTENKVEELTCLATWKDGSTRYLVGLMSEVQRRTSISTDEDMYRCFVYNVNVKESTVYSIAQSADATCNGMTSSVDGSRTMKLVSESQNSYCYFPSWVEHEKWFNLDHSQEYHFTARNTLKIVDGSIEKKLRCILQHKENEFVTVVARYTKGCESGYVCLRIRKRSHSVLELQLSDVKHDFRLCFVPERLTTPYVTLISTHLHPVPCPIQGQYFLDSTNLNFTQETFAATYLRGMEPLKVVNTCYGAWNEGELGVMVAGNPRTMCFLYTSSTRNDTGVLVRYLSVSGVMRSCDRAVVPGRTGDVVFNLTSTSADSGACDQSDKDTAMHARPATWLALLAALLVLGAN